jgi:ferric-dicitrate binding protein FerR (iron transport regulator)
MTTRPDLTRALEAELLGEALPDDDAFVDGVLAAFDRKRATRLRWLALAAVPLAAAAAFALYVHGHPPKETPPTMAPEPIAGMRVESTSGDARVDAGVIATGEGRACVVVDPGVRACVDRDSEARVADLVLAHRRIELVRGRIVVTLDPQPKGTSFSVSTRSGDVTAIGTAFAVAVNDHGTSARVLHGVVRVHGGALDERLGAHERVDLVTHARATSSAEDERDDQAVLDGTPRIEVAAATLEPTPAIVAPVAKPMMPVPPPAELLRAARALRGEHKLVEAAAAYRKLQALHPSSNEAHASYVSLGELQLGGLADPAGALASFDAYLRTPGALTEQARFGRDRALRALGRSDEGSK